jgi:hypothetical protein
MSGLPSLFVLLQKSAESLPELGQAIRRLVNLSYPTVPENVRDTLAKQHLIEALADSEMRIHIKQSSPQNLNDAIRLVANSAGGIFNVHRFWQFLHT